MRRAFLPLLALVLAPGPVLANPEGGTVAAGDAAISGEGTARVLVTQSSQRALIDWQGFSIGAGETTRFIQPGASALAANRVVGGEPSEILGALEANGRVVLINRNGVVFGRGSRVDSAGLLATVHDLDGTSFLTERTLRFDVSGEAGATVVNEGTITVSDAGLAALVAPRVRNGGTIRASRVTLASARGFALDLHGDGLLRFAPGDALEASPGEGALVESDGRLEADGGEIHLSARAAEAVVNASVNVSGVVRARRVSQSGGVIRLEGPGEVRVASQARVEASGGSGGGKVVVEAGQFVNDGAVLAEGGTGAGGRVRIAGARVGLGGRVSATGSSGGEVVVESQGLLSLGERVEARGTTGAGGEVRYVAGRVVETSGAVTDVSGATHGGRIVVEADVHASSGVYRARGGAGHGGFIDLGAADVRLLSASLDASGHGQGGLVRVGGAFGGGEAPDQGAAWYGLMVERWGELPEVGVARDVFVNDGTAIDVSSANGAGGTAVVWSQGRTTFLGAVDARGLSGGGTVALSSAGEVRHGSLGQVRVGDGHLVVEGATVTVGNAEVVQGWSYAGVLGVAKARVRTAARTGTDSATVDAGALQAGDRFGASVSLNWTGTRLAVGVPGDTGANRTTTVAGAVYLFTFADNAFSGGRLDALVGKGYTGGRNVDVGALEAQDRFGTSVSLNRTGSRLAVGAPGDAGADNGTSGAGAVYLFAFANASFSGGRLVAVVGKGYTGGRNVDVGALEGDDEFAASVSLNGTGTRLAVGAPGDGGADNGAYAAGAVYLLTFTNGSFSGGRLAATVGKGYTGGRNVGVATLEEDDLFGASVSLNATGTRLAVGAPGDDGAVNAAVEPGAVYLLTFTNGSFSGGRRAAVVGKGYTGGRNVDVAALERDDQFGTSVSLNAAGTRLAVGAPNDDGADNRASATGAVHLFTFTHASFSGGRRAAVVGKGYRGGRNVDVAALQRNDQFGTSVSLNAAGTRVAVGVPGDAGADNRTSAAGAVHLFTFTNASFSGGSPAIVAGNGYTGGRNVDVAELGGREGFGSSVSLNAAGTRLAVGGPWDDGADDRTPYAGAVYLFTFTDTAFSGGRLAAVVGKGYTGGRNVDVAVLQRNDLFGRSVSLNAAGTRLAVGAPVGVTLFGGSRDTGGAVYLFTFANTSFSGGRLAAVVGKGYTGRRDIDVPALHQFDGFGNSVSLNAAGNRLAVGAPFDDGLDNRTPDDGLSGTGVGAVYLFTFTNASFLGGRLASVVGAGYAGGRNIDVTALQSKDRFGSSVSLNAAGNRLAVGAVYDAGADNATSQAGAAYLFTFTNTSFTGGRLAATVGKGYRGGRNVDVAALDEVDLFGWSVSLNGMGTRLAVGARLDAGAGNETSQAGAVYLFTFSNASFAGGRLAATVGHDYTGGRNVHVPALGPVSRFGSSVSLSAAGNRLAVGSEGAVHLFTFTNASFSDGRLVGTVGKGYTRGLNLNRPTLESYDQFGSSVSLNGAGNRLAVGSPGARAVYLFTFTDTAFSGGRLAAVVGPDYVGGRNVHVPGDSVSFGRSVSLNGAGTRLAVGAPSSGAVHLFTFTDRFFSGGRRVATVGAGYTGGRNVDVAALVRRDWFGTSVSLNAAGTRLAVGAPGDDGADNRLHDDADNHGVGAVYLFTFTDTAFSGGRLAAVVGNGYRGRRNVDVGALELYDDFGASVSLNGAGTRLVVGASDDNGADNSVRVGHGAVYLFTFTDRSFSGGRLAATLGLGYTGGRNIDVTVSGAYNKFGGSVSLNWSGTRLAVGAPGVGPGAVYLFTFTNASFSGGRLAAVVGKGYTGGRNVDVAGLAYNDRFGASVSLNAAGTRLAVGALGDDGADNRVLGASNGINAGAGAVYLFTFTNASFSGGRLVATVGAGYTGGRNINVIVPEEDD